MQGSARSGSPEDQATWSVFVIRIVLDDLSVGYGLPQFPNRDPPHDALVNRMLRKLEFAAGNPLSNLIDQDSMAPASNLPEP